MASMLDVVEIPGTVLISGKILARGVSYEAFLAGYEGMHVEWVNGVVIEMPSINERHDALVQFFRLIFAAYLEQAGGGRILGDPMLMKLENIPSSRAPDHQLKENQVIGPANLVIEVVSPGSQRQDYVEKRREYELGGVPEYWIIDPAKQAALFLQLSSEGLYNENEPDADGIYLSTALSRFRLSVDVLWRDLLPGFSEVARMVEAMFQQ
jgi:Uma2 family endonuclease